MRSTARGLTLNTLRRFGEAAESLERACELEPRRANHWHLLGLARLYNMQPELALKAFERLLALRPERPDAHSLKGIALFDLARYDEALASFDLALKIDPRADDAWMSRGSSLLNSAAPTNLAFLRPGAVGQSASAGRPLQPRRGVAGAGPSRRGEAVASEGPGGACRFRQGAQAPRFARGRLSDALCCPSESFSRKEKIRSCLDAAGLRSTDRAPESTVFTMIPKRYRSPEPPEGQHPEWVW